MSNSIRVNFLYSAILTVSNYFFPFITYPYVSRVLGVEKIGICNFVDGIIHYFILFSMLGIVSVGIREIAKNRNDTQKINRAFSTLFLLNTISTTIVLAILISCIFFIPKFYIYKELMLIGVLKLISNYLLIEWLYKGLENFKLITQRTIIIKIVYVISIFVFVQNESDFIVYYLLTVLMITFNAIYNLLYARKLISFSFVEVNMKYYIKPFFTIGIYMLLTSMYVSFNVAYLGFVANDIEVGYYTTATKIYTIIISLFTAFTGVMLPRMSALLEEGRMQDFRKMILKSYNAFFCFAFPVILLSVTFAPQIIEIIAGKGYEGAITPMRIVMPLMLVIGIEQILVVQILMPLQKDKAIFVCSFVGAIIGVIMNMCLVNIYKSVGSSLVWVSSELVVLCVCQYYVYKYVRIGFPLNVILKNILCAIPIILIIYFLYNFWDVSQYCKLLIMIVVVPIYFILVQVYIVKNDLVVSLVNKSRFLHDLLFTK